MLLPDTVGTGGDSHTRFPIGHLLPGRLRPGGLRGRHRRDAARHAGIGAGALQGQDAARHHAARPGATRSPTAAIQQGLLTVEKKGKKNVFYGRILEIEGLPTTSRSSRRSRSPTPPPSARPPAARSSSTEEPIVEYLTLERHAAALDDRGGLRRRAARWSAARAKMEEWLAKPGAAGGRPGRRVRRGDRDRPGRDQGAAARAARTTRTTSSRCPQVAGDKIDEVFIGSCMTNIGHYRAAGKLLEKFKGLHADAHVDRAADARWTSTS